MTASELLERIEADGVTVVVHGDAEIRIKGKSEAFVRWVETIRERKVEIIEALIERRDYHREWLVYFDQSVKHLIYCPPVTQEYVERQYPGAVRVRVAHKN